MSRAIIAKITEIIQIPGAENVCVAVILGENVVVSKSAQVGDMGVFFPVEAQLSQEFCFENNLFRHSTENKDNMKKGYFEDNRRVRAQPFLGVKSSGLYMTFDSLAYTGKTEFTLGETFDEIGGKKICNKYISKATAEAIARQGRAKAPKLNATPYFDKHVDSAQFKHNASFIKKGSLIHFHAKIHGTSHRSGYTKVIIDLPKWKQLINKVAPIFPTEKWDYVVGTRNVVLSNGGKEGFHGSEQFRFDVAETLKPFLTFGMTIYGEIAGYANGKPIMAPHSPAATKDKAFQKKYDKEVVYKYGCAEHESRFHIYRITQMNADGVNVDFTEAQLEQWCKDYGFNAPLNVCEPIIYDGDLDALMAKVELLTERSELLGEDYIDPSHPGEGIILRIDDGKMNPHFLKSKAYYFRTMEGLCEAVDTEDAS